MEGESRICNSRARTATDTRKMKINTPINKLDTRGMGGQRASKKTNPSINSNVDGVKLPDSEAMCDNQLSKPPGNLTSRDGRYKHRKKGRAINRN